jgi:ATP-dependent DNA helicase Rep
MSQLNPEQRHAITYLSGPLLVIAGAGSGKTRVITHKIHHLIDVCGIAPNHIYAVTFTNKAAREMQERIQSLGEKKRKGKVHVSTFHALGLTILKMEAQHLGLHSNFTVLDSVDSLHLLNELGGKIAAISDEALKGIQQKISQWKNDLIAPDVALMNAANEQEQLAARFFLAYDNALKAYNAVDFDDLIVRPVRLFQENSEVLERWQNKVRYLLVDEYQDTNTAQYQLIKQLCGVRQAFTVVGDDDQSIYAWRGARVENIALLQSDYPQLQVIKLEQNYRSTHNILQAANHLISKNPHAIEKKLWSTLGHGDPVRIIATANDHAEIERVLHEIMSHQFRTRAPHNHYAILYRSNHQARTVEQALREQRIPYQISGGVSFFSRTEIKDLFAYFRLMINPTDDAAFLRCVNTPRRDIGPATIEKIGEYAKTRLCGMLQACSEMGLSEFLQDKALTRVQHFAELINRTVDNANDADHCMPVIENFIQEISYREYLSDVAPNAPAAQKRLENVQELITWLGRLVKPDQESPLSFSEAIQKMTLIDMLDRQSGEENANAVQLLTLHAAKGLEFVHVFIIGCEEECLPHKNSIALDTIEEERRLAYVGMTRAQKTLSLLYAKQRKRFNELQPMTPSRFLSELPDDLVERIGTGEDVPPEIQRASGQAHLANLKALLKES